MKVLSLGCNWSLKIPLTFDFTFNSNESLSRHRANYFRQLIGLFAFDCSFWGKIFEYIGYVLKQRFFLNIYEYLGLSITNCYKISPACPSAADGKPFSLKRGEDPLRIVGLFFFKNFFWYPSLRILMSYWYSMHPRFWNVPHIILQRYLQI